VARLVRLHGSRIEISRSPPSSWAAGLFEETEETTMTSAQQVRNVLLDEYRDLVIEDQADGSAVVRDASTAGSPDDEARGFPVSETLNRCVDLLADSGFVVALVRDGAGVYLNAH
jgi:hypothetical protein